MTDRHQGGNNHILTKISNSTVLFITVKRQEGCTADAECAGHTCHHGSPHCEIHDPNMMHGHCNCHAPGQSIIILTRGINLPNALT